MKYFIYFNIFILILISCSSAKQNPSPQNPLETGTMLQGASLKIDNLDELINALNLGSYHKKGYFGQGLKIAILDNGFFGLQKAIGSNLPPNIKKIDPIKKNNSQTQHGSRLAKIVYSLCIGSNFYDSTGPELYLLNSNGFENLRYAIDKVIQNNIDLVLYAQNWEYGGNLDGKGFINKEINRAIDKGVLWINSAGNFGKASYQDAIKFTKFKEVILPQNNNTLSFKVLEDNTSVKIVAAWNDFKDDYYKIHTKQDLDLRLENINGGLIKESALIQDGLEHKNQKGYSRFPREVIYDQLNKGIYNLKLFAKDTSAFNDQSKFWVTINGFKVEIIKNDISSKPVILPPADNPRVLSVEASDFQYSSFGHILFNGSYISKPDLFAPSLVKFSDNINFSGTSSAAAIAIAAIAVYSSRYGKISDFKKIVNISNLLKDPYLRVSLDPLKKSP